MPTAKFDRKSDGKKLRFIIGNTKSDISGAIYINPGTVITPIEIEFTVLSGDESKFKRMGGIIDGDDR